MSEVSAPTAVSTPAGGAETAPVTTESPSTSGPSPVANVGSASSGSDEGWPEVDWDGWGGKIDDLPEQYRSAATALNSRYDSKYQERASELDNLRAMYAAMLNDEEDPRIGQLTGQLSDLQTQYDAKGTEYGTLETRNKELQNQLSAYERNNATTYVEKFWEEHAELSQDTEKLNRFAEFLTEGGPHGGAWDAYLAVRLMDMPEEVQKIAVDAKKNGVADEYAFQLAEAHAKLTEARSQPTEDQMVVAAKLVEEQKKAKAPRTAAKITNGAVRSAQPQAAKAGMKDATSLDEMRTLAARRALTVHGGGRG